MKNEKWFCINIWVKKIGYNWFPVDFEHRFLIKFLISINFSSKWVVTWHILKILLIQHISNGIRTNRPHFGQGNQIFLNLPITVFHVLKSNQVSIKVHTQLPWAFTLLMHNIPKWSELLKILQHLPEHFGRLNALTG